MEGLKKIFSSKVIFYIILFLFALFLSSLNDNYDYDLYARLIVGEHFFNTGWISYNDFLSYTPTHTWYDHEWGASLIFYFFYKIFGNFGFILVQALTIFITTFFVIKTQKLQNKSFPVSPAFIVLFMSLYSYQNPNIVRCQMFSFMLCAMLIYILEKTRKTDSKLIWLMPLIFMIWNNIHGGVVAGLGLIFIYMVAEFLSGKPWKQYFFVLLITLPLLLINPYGFEYLKFLLLANTKNRMHIAEWWHVFAKWHVVYYYPVFFMSLFIALISLFDNLKNKKIDITKVLVVIICVLAGILKVKLLSLSLIVVASFCYKEFIQLFTKNIIKTLNKISLIFCLTAILLIPLTFPASARTNLERFPVLEVEFIKQNKIKGNILSQFGLSSYISYKLYPQNLIYMDGRYEEVYYDNELDNLRYFEIVDSEKWDRVLKEYPTQILIINKESLIYKHLLKNSEWKKVYEGNLCGVFLPKDFGISKKYLLPTTDINYYRKNEFEKLGKFGK